MRSLTASFAASYQELCNIVETSNSSYCFSQCDLNALLQADEAYDVQLTNYMKKQLFKASHTVGAELTELESVHKMCSMTDCRLLSDESEERRDFIADIRRAELSYSKYEKKTISAQALESSTAAALSFLQQKQAQNAENLILSYGGAHVRHSLESMKKKSKELEQFTKIKIPVLISQGTPLQTARLLTGDYRTKLACHDYFVEKQQKVMSLLERQGNRLSLLWNLFQVEKASHVKTGEQILNLLKQLKSLLDRCIEELKWFEGNGNRIASMVQSTDFHCKYDALTAVLNLLGIKSEYPSSSLTFHERLPHAADMLQKQLNLLWKNTTAPSNPDEFCLNSLLFEIRECENFLASDVTGRGDCDEVVFTPHSMQRMMNELQKASDHLSSLIFNSSKEIEKKNRFLGYEKKAAMLRNTWIDFYLQ